MILTILLGLIAVTIILIIIRKITWLPAPYPTVAPPQNEIPHFDEIPTNFVHKFNKKKSLPFMGAAVFDLKGDGEQYLFVGGGYNQPDKLYVFRDNAFVDITDDSGITKDPEDTTYGAVSIDVNNDGIIDLFITRESGVFLYTYANGKYEGKKLDIPLDPKHAPLSIAVADLKKRGLVDIFVCAYVKVPYVEGQSIFNKEGYGAKSLLMLNNGDNTFTDITDEAGLNYVHNTFQAVFVDLDGSGELDLVVAYDTGHVGTYKNMGNLTFKDMPNPTTDVYNYPMGIAVGDYAGEGRPDLFFSNIGPFNFPSIGASPPNLLVRGDLKKDQYLLRTNILLKNEGNFKFDDIAKEAKVADYGFGWGTLFQDFTNNGSLDIALAQNYIGFPPHKFLRLPCRLLMQVKDKTFVPVEKNAGVNNPYFAISPLTVDFTGNGYPDLIYTNLGGDLRVFLNKGGSNNFLKVELANEPTSLGATVIVDQENGKTLTGFFVPTQGLCTSQTNTLSFGLGDNTNIKKVTVTFLNGKIKEFESPKAGSTIQVGKP
jgi:enediyne biosynthesis protein E4